MAEPLVVGREVSRVFGRGDRAVTAVVSADFEVRAGESVGLVGPSGSGKSTLMHLIAGLEEPTSGTLEWPALGGKDTLRPRNVGIAFQGPSLLPPLTVAENVALPALLAGWPEDRAQEAAEALISRFRLLEVEAKLPEELSGGQTQRAGLARALVAGPKLVLTDEPTGQQDQETASHVVEALLELVEEAGAALLVATHDEAVASRLGSRWSMEGGKFRGGVAARSA